MAKKSGASIVDSWRDRLLEREPSLVLGTGLMFPLLLFFSLPSLSLNLLDVLHYSGICGVLGLYTLIAFFAWNRWLDAYYMKNKASVDATTSLTTLIIIGYYSIFCLFISVFSLRTTLEVAGSSLPPFVYQRTLLIASVIWPATIIVFVLVGAPHLFRPFNLSENAQPSNPKHMIARGWLIGSLIGIFVFMIQKIPLPRIVDVLQIGVLLGLSTMLLAESVAGWNDFRLIFGHGIRIVRER